MPALFRFLMTLLVLGGIAFGGMLALANLVEPTPREMVQSVPASRFAK